MKRNTLNTFITATLIMLLGVSSSAKAIVPAGNLMGTTSVTWGEETPSEIQTSIQSILVPAPPILLGPDNQTSISEAHLVGDDALQYTIISKANGKDTYSLSLVVARDRVAGGDTITLSKSEVTLGATAAMEAADAGATEIKVPSDGVIDNEVNGITNGDTVSINNDPYTVGEVVDDGNTATIPLTTDGGLISPVAFGDRIAQQETFAVSLDPVGTITDDEGTGTVTITVTATSKASRGRVQRATDDVVLTLQTPVGPSVEKYVRNVTPENDRNPADNLEWVEEGFAYEYPSGSETFYFRSQLNDDDARDPSKNPDAKVDAEEDDILEYLIVLKAGNQGEQSNITLNESLPPFASYLTASAKINNESIEDNDDDNSPVLTEDWTVTNAKGPLTIDTNGLAYITYQVTVIGGVGDGEDSAWLIGGPSDECRHDADGLWAPDMNAIKCKGVKWNAANGQQANGGPMVEHNPVCWSKEVQYGSGENPWVVGTTAQFNIAAYDCRTKCAGGPEGLSYCAADGWWQNDAAESTMCVWQGQSRALQYVERLGGIRQVCSTVM